MLIEFDETKRAKTLQERGLDFANAGQVLDGAQLTQVEERHHYDELRNITFGAGSQVCRSGHRQHLDRAWSETGLGV